MHVAPSATTNGKLEAYGAPPLSVVPSEQLRLQPISSGAQPPVTPHRLIPEQVITEEIDGAAGGEGGDGGGRGGDGGKGGDGGNSGGEGGGSNSGSEGGGGKAPPPQTQHMVLKEKSASSVL